MESTFNGSYNGQEANLKRVFYTGTDTIEEGMVVCYDYNATEDLDGVTVAEGDGNPSRWTKVEKADANNIDFFAGVVFSSSYAGKAGPRWIDIFTPNGAIVPVRASASITNGDLLYINAADYTMNKTPGTLVGRAVETVDRSVTNGLVLAKILHAPLA